MENQYNDMVSAKYTNLVKADPAKLYVQYPEALRFLGDVKGKKVLDVGCGSGAFDVLLEEKGSIITGYDKSSQQVISARRACNGDFFVASPKEFYFASKFDKAVSILVLHYSEDIKELQRFFSSTHNVLKNNGIFVCILMNPDFKGYGKIRYNRRYVLSGDEIRADFINRKGAVDFSVNYLNFSKNDYEKSAKKAGFHLIEWRKLGCNFAGINEMGEDYWQGFEDDCPYVGFVAYK